ncbi:hypothetical protein AB0M95_06775 [Sphaerisporangium sp. NPDC051017]|uniref:hypothetical protein n=1 Tax=Sphaerisporangium sp. NPDC051017 TaxID=3154636 RepID=UPI00342F7006
MTPATMAQTMPVLDSHARRCAGTLAGIDVLFIGHGTGVPVIWSRFDPMACEDCAVVVLGEAEQGGQP